MLRKTIQFGDLKQLVNIILEYAPNLYFTTRIAHMEVEETFGSWKWKPYVLQGLEGDSHRHNRVHFSHPCVNIQIGKLHVQIEWPSFSIHHYEVVDIINGGVEVLKALCENGVWHC